MVFRSSFCGLGYYIKVNGPLVPSQQELQALKAAEEAKHAIKSPR